ncbi:MAG: DNA-processing protein DprA [Planctomycetia bacterium]|nr:DNA-processing protein DprA [Planctomycetia bacterium]
MRLLDFTSGGTMMTLPDDELRQQRDDALVESLRLSLIPGVGPLTRRALLARFGSPEAVFRAAPDELRSVHGVGPKLMRSIVAAGDEIDPESEIALCRANDVAILTEADEAYPRMLREIHDPPGVLFVRGELLPQDALAVAIVGTRHATQYGLRQAELLAGSLARAGLTIVSGLARGIDAAAHRGALGAGGRTIAVLASGVLNIYPPEHKELARQVIAHGALLSESPPRFAPLSGAFPQRNRLISGLALGAIIVEAAERSGALITARLAAEQDREVFAVPGHIDSRTARGCHRLIRDGAKLVESADDVLEELGPLVQATPRADGQIVHHPAELLLNEPEKAVLAAIDGEATSIDQIVVDTGMAVAQVLSTLSVLEMRRLIRRLSGSTVVRV